MTTPMQMPPRGSNGNLSLGLGQAGLELGAYLSGIRHKFSIGTNDLLSQKEGPLKTAEALGDEYERFYELTNLGDSLITTGLFIEGHKIANGNFIERRSEVIFLGETPPYNLSPRRELLEVIFVEKLLRRGDKFRPTVSQVKNAGLPPEINNGHKNGDSIYTKKISLSSLHIAFLQIRGVQMIIFMDPHGVEFVQLSLK